MIKLLFFYRAHIFFTVSVYIFTLVYYHRPIMGKYKNRGSQTVAELALNNLLKNIPRMITNYGEAMNRFAKDQEAQDRYVRGVATWTSIMRDEQTRMEIASAVSRAKARYRNMVAGGYSTIPMTVPQR